MQNQSGNAIGNRSVSEAASVLDLDEVEVTYPGGVTALHSSSFQIRKGEVTVLLGRSGAGKSTLLRCLNQLVRPTRGSVTSPHHGRLVSPRSIRNHRRETGMVFQQHQLIGRQSALVNVLTGRLSRYGSLRSILPLPQSERERSLHCLDRVGLLEKALQRVDQLSGGQQQRVGVARALVMEPSLLLADEPVASLDPATSEELLTLLHDICRKDGITLVISLHQVDYARKFADRIIGLAGGHIIFDGPAGELDETALSRIYGRPDQSSEANPNAKRPTTRSEPALVKTSG